MTALATEIPETIHPLVAFSTLLRAHGFAVAPDQTIGFLQGISLLGPGTLADIRRAGVAMLAIPRERQDEYDLLFDAHFLGASLPAATPGEEEAEAHEVPGGEAEAELGDEQDPGREAAMQERLGTRPLASRREDALTLLARLAPARLPRRRSRRFAPARRGEALDLRRILREAVRREGEIFHLSEKRRKRRQRRVILLIDVSGSMRERTEESLGLAHTLVQVAERAEAFTLGTRLTRITPALRLRQRAAALDRAGQAIADIDGGTRIGEALQSFLAVPRFAGFARGGYALMLSDGLERGAPDALAEAMRRLVRLAWRMDWLTPLAGDDYVPETEAMRAILPHLHSLGDGRDTAAIVTHLLDRAARP